MRGDLNEFEFVSPVRDILSERSFNLTDPLPESERNTFVFKGNLQIDPPTSAYQIISCPPHY